MTDALPMATLETSLLGSVECIEESKGHGKDTLPESWASKLNKAMGLQLGTNSQWYKGRILGPYTLHLSIMMIDRGED